MSEDTRLHEYRAPGGVKKCEIHCGKIILRTVNFAD
jgi:hypothetical protein